MRKMDNNVDLVVDLLRKVASRIGIPYSKEEIKEVRMALKRATTKEVEQVQKWAEEVLRRGR